MSDRVQFNVRIDADLLAKAKEFAKEQEKTLSDLVIDGIRLALGISVPPETVASPELEERIAHLESYHDSLNKLCFYSFGLAFARLQRLEEFIESVTEAQERPSITQIAQEAGRELRRSPELISVSIEPEGISQAKLAKRFKRDEQTIARHRVKDDFAEWSRGEDPDKIGWRYNPTKKKFFAVTE